MGVVRACLPCRNAKAKCDLVRPVCSRCEQRRLSCSGFSSDGAFIFRDENEASQRNSERARKRPREDRVFTTPLDIAPSQAVQKRQKHALPYLADSGLQLQYSWLNEMSLSEIPGVLKRDLETRAIDRFFVNWTLYPPNNETSTGYMHDLPTLYLSAPPQSVLWQAVRAVAFSDMKRTSAGEKNFYIMAQRHYGKALSLIRAASHDEQELANDHVLAAILLIDNFESMYLARTEPLGPHSDAIKYILRAGGDEHILNRSRFALWCVAHQRLQSHQILFGEEPSLEQLLWVRKLNIDRPDVHVSSDVLQMSALSAAAKNLTQESKNGWISISEKIEKIRQVAHKSRDLIASIEEWTSEMHSAQKVNATKRANIAQPQEMGDTFNLSIPDSPHPKVLDHQDVWLSYKLNCHCASQIVFRESLIDLIRRSATLEQQDVNRENTEFIEAQQQAIDRLSAAVIQSYPSFLGLANNNSEESCSPLQGRMAGRLFSIFPMWVIQRAKFTSDLHKRTASEVIDWINYRHGLD